MRRVAGHITRAAANASARDQRAAILASPLSELTDFNLTVGCLSPGCARDRTFAVADLATFYGGQTVGDVLRRMQCSGACGGCGRGVAGNGASRVECSCQTAPRGDVGVGGAGLRRSMMPLPPLVHHLLGDLAGIADRPRWRCDNLLPALARATVQVVRLIWAHAPTAITGLAFPH